MIILSSINDLKENIETKKVAITIGNFDGVHIGHQYLLKNFLRFSNQRGLIPVVVTFSPHPFVYLGKVKNHLLSVKESKEQILKDLKIPYVLNLEFNNALANQTGEEFISDLCQKLENIQAFYLGHDFSLGAKKQFNAKSLKELLPSSYEIILDKQFQFENNCVSSSIIRDELERGNLAQANKFLARPFCLEGKVVKGNQIGRSLGFPTANILTHPDAFIPKNGVYLGRVSVLNQTFAAAVNIGLRPTVVDKSKTTIEAHILGFNEQIYDKDIKVELIKFIRDEKKFSSDKKLIEQINNDLKKMKILPFEQKMGLIGKDITHSLSAGVYQKFLSNIPIKYDLLDYSCEQQIPPLDELLKIIPYISVTAPYKRYIYENCKSLGLEKIKAVNAIKVEDSKVVGTNTDLEACNELLKEYTQDGYNKFILLGDGAMASIFLMLFEKYNLTFCQLSRKQNNLNQIEKKIKEQKNSDKLMVINACGRSFMFPKLEVNSFTFWDLNYSMPEHQKLFHTMGVSYIDGAELLERQASRALSFWNLKNS